MSWEDDNDDDDGFYEKSKTDITETIWEDPNDVLTGIVFVVRPTNQMSVAKGFF